MKKVFRTSALTVIVLLLFGCQDKSNRAHVELDSDAQKTAYAIGASVGSFAGRTLKQHDDLGVHLDRSLVQQGLLDAIDNKVIMSEEDMGETLRMHEKKMNTIAQEKAKEQREETRQTAAKYLEENAKKTGVTVTESGLQYEVIEQGEGAKPALSDTVTVHYTGMLVDGTVFDSSRERGEPATFPLANVIKGWAEGVSLMSVGSRYRLVIPSELAYGERKVGTIPAESALIFDVELISIGVEEE